MKPKFLKLKKLFLLPLYFYKFIISPILPKSCRYIPSCSEYAIQSFKMHKPHIAFFLTAKRLLSCHPFSKKEILDEVPLIISKKVPLKFPKNSSFKIFKRKKSLDA